MAALEYLTQNSLAAYPFKDRKATNPVSAEPIQDDWFYDILFVSYHPSIRSVYVSSIEKTEEGDLCIVFSNAETFEQITPSVTIPSSDVVDHLNNIYSGFASTSNEFFAVKFVLGPGLTTKSVFIQEYTCSEGELVNSAIKLYSPRLSKLTFEAYDSRVSDTSFEVYQYAPLTVPTVALRYNTAFIAESSNYGGLFVGRGLGAGLYDNCPKAGFIEDVYTINNTVPNPSGAITLNVSSCYTNNVLTESNEIVLGSILNPYRVFELLGENETTSTRDVVMSGHSLVLQNFCKPKCAPESLGAFAYYLNRVTDGASDLGDIANNVISNMNSAAAAYNLASLSYLLPYFKVKYTTNEAYNTSGQYVTYLALAVAIFNPSSTAITARAVFTPTILQQEGSIKIRTASDVNVVTDPVVTIACRDYAFIEIVYYIAAGVTGGNLSIDVFDVGSEPSLQIGNTYYLYSINGLEDPGSVTGAANTFRVTQQGWESFSETLSIPSNVTSVTFYGDTPSWLALVPNYTTHEIALNITAEPSDTANKRYTIYYRSSLGSISQLIIDYVADPIIISPLASKYPSSSPLSVSNTAEYTSENPLFVISASNMTRLSSDFPSDDANFYYIAEPVAPATALPLGLIFDSVTGRVTGSLDPSVTLGTAFQLNISAVNPSGSASNPQLINLAAAIGSVPAVSFSEETPGDSFIIDNLSIYTSETPVVSFVSTNPPIYKYTLQGTLPTGLEFSAVSGKITGQVSTLTGGSVELLVYATNFYGQSSPLSFSITYTIYQAPTLTYPDSGEEIQALFTSVTTLIDPLFTVTGTQAYGNLDNFELGLTDTTRNSYTAIGIPAGFYLDVYTGKFYGELDPSEYPADPNSTFAKSYAIRITATNPIGKVSKNIQLTLYSEGVPIINNVAANRVIEVVKANTYTQASPLIKIVALNSPTDFAATGLPAGLSCLNSGEIVGTVAKNVQAADHQVSLTAINAVGSSDVVSCVFRVPVSIITPESNTLYDLVVDTSYSNIVTPSTCTIAPPDQITLTVTNLPTGLVFQDGKISGTPTLRGNFSPIITATSSNHGKDVVAIGMAVDVAKYSISGTVVNDLGDPIEGATVTNNLGLTTTTNSLGEYTLTGLQPGIYNVSAYKTGYSIVPSYQATTISSSDVTNVDFTSDGPPRIVTGKITKSDESPVKGILVTDGLVSTATDSFGNYALYVSRFAARTITPISTAYVFTPSEINIPIGTQDVPNSNFSAASIVPPGAPTVISASPGDTQISLEFTAPTNNGGGTITNYQYSLDGGTTWITRTPASATSPIIIPGLTNGTSYEY